MEKTIFRILDRVFSYDNGWGTVYDIDTIRKYPICVQFDNGKNMSYTHDGKRLEDEPKTLSLTEYTLQGFSQERPIELPEVGELCLVKVNGQEHWVVRNFIRRRSDGMFITTNSYGESEALWQQMKRIKILD
jgi:hypothetical protein